MAASSPGPRSRNPIALFLALTTSFALGTCAGWCPGAPLRTSSGTPQTLLDGSHPAPRSFPDAYSGLSSVGRRRAATKQHEQPIHQPGGEVVQGERAHIRRNVHFAAVLLDRLDRLLGHLFGEIASSELRQSGICRIVVVKRRLHLAGQDGRDRDPGPGELVPERLGKALVGRLVAP